MIETTEHKATLSVRHGSVVGVRTDRMGPVLALTVGAQTGRPAKLNAYQCHELAAYLIRQAAELVRDETDEQAPEQANRQAAGRPAAGLYDRRPAPPLVGIDSHWESR